MVIEYDYLNELWGMDTPGSSISVNAFGSTYNTTVDSTGKFTVTLAGQPISTTPVSIVITSSSGGAVTLEDVLVGYTFIMSGQVSFFLSSPFSRLVIVCGSHRGTARTHTYSL